MRLFDSKALLGFSAACGVLLAPAIFAPAEFQDDHPTVEEIDEAGELFRSSCAACHLPPDPEHSTDAAWLTQVTDTA